MTDIEGERIDAMNDALSVLQLLRDGDVLISPGKVPIVVFDIDDTLIDSRTGHLIEPMMIIYRQVQAMGIPIFLITARSPQYAMETSDELERLGILGFDDLIFVDNDIRRVYKTRYAFSEDKAMRKAQMRRSLENQGYDIILNLGDDPGDMMYGYYRYGIKLPYLY